MITNTFVHLISKNGFQNLIQNTTAQVSIETGLKAVGRPAFTLADTHVDKETRKCGPRWLLPYIYRSHNYMIMLHNLAVMTRISKLI